MSWLKRYEQYKNWSFIKLTFQHEFETNQDYHLTDDPCKTEANLLYRNLNSYLETRQSVSVFHLSNGFFVPNGEKVMMPNFVDSSFKSEYVKPDNNYFSMPYWTRPELKKNAKSTLRHWTQETVRYKVC